jgi:hypothetical protein
MEYCPICKSYLKFNLTYNCGIPAIFYSCNNCGYNSNYRTVNVNSTSSTLNLNLNLNSNSQNTISNRSNIINDDYGRN